MINLDQKLANVARARIVSWKCWSYWSHEHTWLLCLISKALKNDCQITSVTCDPNKNIASYKRSLGQNKAPKMFLVVMCGDEAYKFSKYLFRMRQLKEMHGTAKASLLNQSNGARNGSAVFEGLQVCNLCKSQV